MLVQFNPQINTGSSPDACYMNFLRCVRAIATAAAGTSSLTVNPFTNNTGTIDNTKNCIVSILSNTEAGGWTESTRSNVIQSGSFTAGTSISAYTYLFDCYAPSGKGTFPYLKWSVTTGHNQANSSDPIFTLPGTCYTFPAAAATCIQPMFTGGYSTSTDWTDTTYPPGNGTFTNAPNLNGMNPTLKRSASIGGSYHFTSQNSSYYSQHAWNPYVASGTQNTYYMACTANYVIIWETNSTNNYLNGYGSLNVGVGPGYYQNFAYGNLWYFGFRETQAWENSYSNNPPIAVMHLQPQRNGTNGTTSPVGLNGIWAPMLTINNAGVVNTTLGIGVLMSYWNQPDLIGNPYNWNLAQNLTTALNNQNSLDQPLVLREISSSYGVAAKTNIIYKPGVDNTTGLAVPPAFPIMIRRSTSDAWNPGGALRGIYKSLSGPIAYLRNYFANGQTFTIYNSVTGVNDTYLPIVFNEDMYLIRFA